MDYTTLCDLVPSASVTEIIHVLSMTRSSQGLWESISRIWSYFILSNFIFSLSQFLLELKETVLRHKYFLRWPYVLLPSIRGDKPFLTALSCSSCLNCYLLLTSVNSTWLHASIVTGYISVFCARTRVLWTVLVSYNNFLFPCVCLCVCVRVCV